MCRIYPTNFNAHQLQQILCAELQTESEEESTQQKLVSVYRNTVIIISFKCEDMRVCRCRYGSKMRANAQFTTFEWVTLSRTLCAFRLENNFIYLQNFLQLVHETERRKVKLWLNDVKNKIYVQTCIFSVRLKKRWM